MSLKWLVWGSKGWIGQMVVNMLHENNQTVIPAKSLAGDALAVEAEIQEHQPDRLVSLIGRTHGASYTTIDYLEQPGKLKINMRDNLFCPMLLANMARKHKLHLTYLGTGCIFTYDDPMEPDMGQKFTEDSLPNFFGSGYSTVKGFTDQLMHQFDDCVLNVRIRMPISHQPNSRNLITKLVNYSKICSVPNSMTVLPELLPKMLHMAGQRQTGTINLTNPGVITHNQILEMYKEIVDPEHSWENFSLTEQADILSAGRSNNYLHTGKLEKLYPETKGIVDSVRHVLYEYAKQLPTSIKAETESKEEATETYEPVMATAENQTLNEAQRQVVNNYEVNEALLEEHEESLEDKEHEEEKEE